MDIGNLKQYINLHCFSCNLLLNWVCMILVFKPTNKKETYLAGKKIKLKTKANLSLIENIGSKLLMGLLPKQFNS